MHKFVLLAALAAALAGCGGRDAHFDSDIPGLTAAVAATMAPSVAATCGMPAESYRASAEYETRTTRIGLTNTSFDARVRC